MRKKALALALALTAAPGARLLNWSDLRTEHLGRLR
jgi:hypothetical protein